MKSLHARLDPIQGEVLKFTETFGRLPAMQHYQVASYDRFSQWLEEVTQNAKCGLYPKINLQGHQSLGDQLVEAFLRKVAKLEAQLAESHAEIVHLKWLLEQGHDKDQVQAVSVLEACKC